MQALSELKKKLSAYRPCAWDQMPDFPLYMDQLVAYMPRQVLSLEGGEKLTSSMVNNYIKEGLLPRAKGKRYTREHLAYLTAICMLKQVLTVKELGTVLPPVSPDTDVESYYSELLGTLEGEIGEVSSLIAAGAPDVTLSEMAVQLAVSAYCRQYLCKQILEYMSETGDDDKKKDTK